MIGLVVLSLGTPDACGLSHRSVIGPEGGVVLSEDGRMSLEIPEDALAEDTLISLDAIPCDEEDLADCYTVGPRGVTFHRPVTAVYEAGELDEIDSVTLLIMRGDGWKRMPDARVDHEEEVVTGSMMYTSAISVDAP